MNNQGGWEKKLIYILMSMRMGAEPGLGCIRYKDITEIKNPFDDSVKTEYYSTSEVLQVIDQWIEYLEKFYAEKDK